MHISDFQRSVEISSPIFDEKLVRNITGLPLPKEVAELLKAEQLAILAALALCGEAGETAEEFKKAFRDDQYILEEFRRKRIAAELGDVLFHVAYLANKAGVNLDVIAAQTLAKVEEKNVIYGNQHKSG